MKLSSSNILTSLYITWNVIGDVGNDTSKIVVCAFTPLPMTRGSSIVSRPLPMQLYHHQQQKGRRHHRGTFMTASSSADDESDEESDDESSSLEPQLPQQQQQESKAWSCSIASPSEYDSDGRKITNDLVEYDYVDDVPVSSVDYSLSTPREWMEAIERNEGALGTGAYTVLRCDLDSVPKEMKGLPSNDGYIDVSVSGDEDDNTNGVNGNYGLRLIEDKDNFFIWGEPFHLDRMTQSYAMLLMSRGEGVGVTMSAMAYGDIMDNADHRSRYIIRTLLKQAKDAADRDGSILVDVDDDQGDDVQKLVVTLTLLWTNDVTGGIKVRGHAYIGDKTPTSLFRYNPNPISATVAVPSKAQIDASVKRDDGSDNGDEDDDDDGASSVKGLPQRHNRLPRAKLSTWCRERRPLEETFKSPGIDEVFMVKEIENYDVANIVDVNRKKTWKLLEGLTSNLFIVYKDGSLRTAGEGVLEGYAHNLVVDAARRCGIDVVTSSTFMNPIRLEDGKDGYWAEAFVTSAVNLIVPVSRILIPDYDEKDEEGDGSLSFTELWSESSLEELPWDEPTWRILYEDIMRYNLYSINIR